MNEDQFFYVGQKAFILKGNEVLVLVNPQGKLDFPGGKIQTHELDLKESLKREVREETGLEITVGDPFATWINVMSENHKLAGKKIFLVAYKCEYVSDEVKLSHEHDTFKWVNKENYNELDNKTSYFEVLKKYFN